MEKKRTILNALRRLRLFFWNDQPIPSGHLDLISPSSIPKLGSIQAGFPSPEEEALRDIMSMDEYLIPRPNSSFLLEVSGDSMIGEGIMLSSLKGGDNPRLGTW